MNRSLWRSLARWALCLIMVGCIENGGGPIEDGDSGDGDLDARAVVDGGRDSRVPQPPQRDAGWDARPGDHDGEVEDTGGPDADTGVEPTCEDGAVERRRCGDGGEHARRCDDGRWGPFGECEGGPCEPGSTEIRPCGHNNRGTHARDCPEDGMWGSFGACEDPDVCRDGSREEDACGAGGPNMRERLCAEGRWGRWTLCDGRELCPNPENPECGPPRLEACNGLDDDHDGLIDEGLVPEAGEGRAPTAFEREVDEAIERGLAHLRVRENGTGRISDDARATFLGVLAFLERRANHGAGAPVGYRGLDANDQALVLRLVRGLIDGDPALLAPGGPPYVYTTGGNLMALSAYLRSGGPDDVGARVTPSAALANGVGNLQRIQGMGNRAWSYEQEGADFSTTHFAVNGLAAAADLVPEAESTLPRVSGLLESVRNVDGGFGYNPNAVSSTSMTGAGVYVARAIGLPADRAAVQGGIDWLAANHRPDRMVGSFAGSSTYYAFWSVWKGLALSDYLQDPRFAARQPAELGWPDEPPGVWFDYAVSLLRWQSPDGAFRRDFGGAPGGWDEVSTHVFSLLLLQRSLGGLPHPVAGVDGPPACADGIDNDGDGLIDLADPDCFFACTPSEATLPACRNRIDDDGDGRIDFPEDPGCLSPNDDDESSPACANDLDDDGDGLIDWPEDPGCASRLDGDERNPDPLPACANGVDDDGDGRVDWPADTDCLSAGQDDEGGRFACPAGHTPELIRPETRIVRDSTEGAPALLASGCGPDDGPERVYALAVDRPTRVTLTTAHPDTRIDTVLSVRDGCGRDAARVACNDDVAGGDGASTVSVELAPGIWYVVVDTHGEPGPFALVIERQARAAACSNGLDDDGDGRIDWPDDPGCTDPGDDDETNSGPLRPRCSDGVDNDLDGLVDLADPGCENSDGDDETTPAVLPECADGVDNDADGLIDWPADDGCQGRGDSPEDQSCRDGLHVQDVPADGRVVGATQVDGTDSFHSVCGGHNAPDRAFRYVLEQPARQLVFSADNPGTDYPVILTVTRDCDERRAIVGCAGDVVRPEPSVIIRDARPGQYFVVIDSGGADRWVGGEGAIPMPPDPRNFVARQDLRQNCGWNDGGNDAFDCYGRFHVTHGGQASGELDVTAGERQMAVGGYDLRWISDFPHSNVWRVQLLPGRENDERPVSIRMTGNLGSDGSTVSRMGTVEFDGRQIPYLNTSDRFEAPGDPPVVHLVAPSDPEQIERVDYAILNDNVTITLDNVTLPVTFYTAISYGDQPEVARAVVSNLEIQTGPGGENAPRHGNFELTVRAE